jgi:hypothetical protein
VVPGPLVGRPLKVWNARAVRDLRIDVTPTTRTTA